MKRTALTVLFFTGGFLTPTLAQASLESIFDSAPATAKQKKQSPPTLAQASLESIFDSTPATAPSHFSANVAGQRLIAQNKSKKNNEINAYDPFADYSEFENTAEEQENIHFFQHGRFLTLGATGGIKIFTMNMATLYPLGPSYGGYLNYFFDMNFAIQFGLMGSSHSIALKTQTGENFIGAADFISIGIDFKYFVDKNLFNKNFDWFQPYFFLGVLYSSVTLWATLTDQSGLYEDNGYGINMGLGMEFQFFRKIHFGLQYAFKFVTLAQEAIPLELNIGNQKRNTNFRPYGDWMNINIILGVNF